MNYNELSSVFHNFIKTEKEANIRIWVGPDGIYHDSNYPTDNDELVCYCGISYSPDRGEWIVTPWLFMSDCPATFQTASSTLKMSYFWVNWMGVSLWHWVW